MVAGELQAAEVNPLMLAAVVQLGAAVNSPTGKVHDLTDEDTEQLPLIQSRFSPVTLPAVSTLAVNTYSQFLKSLHLPV